MSIFTRMIPKSWPKQLRRHVQPDDEETYTDRQLTYAATNRCPCGAGLAYAPGSIKGLSGAWDCSDILTGRAIPTGEEGSKQHTDRLPFTFYEIKGENQPSAKAAGQTTRPT